jgi:hypothetical protein
LDRTCPTGSARLRSIMNPAQAIRKLRDVIRQVRARVGVRQAQKQKAKQTGAERTVASVRRAGSTTDGKDAPRDYLKGLSRRSPCASVLSNALVVKPQTHFISSMSSRRPPHEHCVVSPA